MCAGGVGLISFKQLKLLDVLGSVAVLIDRHSAGDSSLIARLFDHIERKGAQSGDLISRAHH